MKNRFFERSIIFVVGLPLDRLGHPHMIVWEMTVEVAKFGECLTSCICVIHLVIGHKFRDKVKMTQEREKSIHL